MQNLKFFLMKLFISLKHFFSNLGEVEKKVISTTVDIVNAVKTWDGEHAGLIAFVEGLLPGVARPIIDKVLAIINTVGGYKDLTGDDLKLFLHNLSLQVGLVLADGHISFSEIVHLIQWYFDNHKGVNPPVALLDNNSHIAATIEATHAAAVEATPEKSNEELHAALVQKIADTHS